MASVIEADEPSGDDQATENGRLRGSGESPKGSTEEQYKFTILDLLLLIWCIASYFFDIGTDVVLAYFYWEDDHVSYFTLTIAFVLMPSMTVSGISFSWYFEDAKDESGKDSGDSKQSYHKASAVPHWVWIVRIVMHVLQLAPVMRYVESIAHGIRSAYYSGERRRQCYEKMAIEDADASLLRLFEAFMESAPQLVLQLYILARNAQTIRIHYMLGFRSNVVREEYIAEKLHFQPGIGQQDPFLLQSSAATVLFQVFSVLTSLVSLAWALVGYQRQARLTIPEKNDITIVGCIVYFLWRLGTVAARVIALAVFASVFSFWIALVCAVHWVVMTTWLVVQKTGMYDSCIKEFLFCAALGIVYNFAFVNVKDEPTRWKATFFYMVQFAEDTVMVSLWFVFGDRFTWFYYPTLVVQIGSFWLGIAFMVLYYTNFHPNGPHPISRCSRVAKYNVPSERTINSGRTVTDRAAGIKGLRRASHALISTTINNANV